MSTTFDQPDTRATAASDGYRTLWRWHFYAGLFVMPFLVVLAITGTLYCFKAQLEPMLYPHRLVVEPQSTAKLDADTLLGHALSAVPAGSVPVSVQVLTDADRSAEFVFRLPDGDQQSVYVNPYDGKVLGTLSVANRFMQVDRMLHRKLLLGKPGELVMELAACWTLVMIGTGVALWWPRRQNGQRAEFWPRFSLRERPLWKSVHAAMGIWLAIGAAAFVLTGLPWTGSWGKHFKSLATSANLGSPPGSWGDLAVQSVLPGQPARPTAHDAHSMAAMHHHDGDDSMPGMVMDDLPVPIEPWAVGNVPVPDSGAASVAAKPLPIQQLIGQAAALGVSNDYTLALPASREGVYTVSYFPADPKLERTIYIDQYSGAVIRDIRYADYGAIAQAVSYGTSLHMGRYFGLGNQIVSALISLGLGAMAITGAVMWWKRRPARRLGAPSRERGAPPMRGWVAGLVLLGAIFPLMGATIVLVWIADRFVFRHMGQRVA
ncbi:PepSY-associated TM helix domain-containing protein [Paraburkholderia bannensis]|uniref:PepSY-associated TM helix domain-containing protein n=1 Tax=Paraburkholderia bannensis TaxID=765414 RepID=UPI000480BFBD|nr:PepSY domain-containing protein [Paraburkholderia bannensis]